MSVYINNNQPGLSAKVKPGIVSILRSPYLSKKSLLVLHLKFGRAENIGLNLRKIDR